MTITSDLLEIINRSIADYPPESGGILGSGNGEIIDNVVFDIPDHESSMGCAYSPDVDFLNKSIKQWSGDGIRFMGIFHTHFYGVQTLSCADKHYIDTIMQAMPEEINCLYFPVYVLPERKFVGYSATRKSGCVEIQQEILYIRT